LDECILRRHVRNLGFACDEGRCLFWSHFGGDTTEPQCAIEYLQLLGDSGRELAEWLLSLKEREDIARALGITGPEGG
jgi:hypothetical protein